MSKKDSYIAFIKDELRKGNVEYKNIVSVFCGKFRCTDRTFDKYWKLANEEYKQEFEAVESKKIDERTETETKAVRSDILSKQDSLAILSKMVNSDLESTRDRISAVNQLSKMEGWEAPKQVETKDTTIIVSDANKMG